MRSKKLVDVAAAETVGPAAGSAALVRSKLAAPTAELSSPKQRPSRLPAALQFPLIVILSFSLSVLGYSLLDEGARAELAGVTRPLERSEVALVSCWRIFELALCWFGSYDGYDLAALSLLAHGPQQYLLTAFYGLRLQTAAASLCIDVLSGLIPFLLLRPLSAVHATSQAAPYREILTDRPIQGYTTLLASLIYGVTLLVSFELFLPDIFVLYFEGIPSVKPAWDAASGKIAAAVFALACGMASRVFIFSPVAATERTREDTELAKFDPVTSTLSQTLWWNLWGFTARTKVAMTRTAVVVLLTAVDTYIQCVFSAGRVEPYGAAAYASAWVTAAAVTGTALLVVGGD